jgi:hypothetical protein
MLTNLVVKNGPEQKPIIKGSKDKDKKTHTRKEKRERIDRR